MSLHLRATTPLRVRTTTYNTDGVGVAWLPTVATALLTAAGTNVQQISIRATAGTAASSKELHFSATTATNSAAATLSYVRPFGGSGLATLAQLRAIQILLTADPVTTAEIEAASTATRATSGYWTLTDTTLVTTFAKGVFEIDTAGEAYARTVILPEDLGASVKLNFYFTTFALATHLQVLTAAE